MNTKKSNQNGAVSIFIVVFSALLITIVTVSFVRVMMQDQQQATMIDLSRSAYDSAQAGVEDAKLALLRYQATCNTNGDLSADCVKQRAWINSNDCNVATNSDPANTAEVKVQTGGSNNLDQAYTCVKVKLVTDDYLGVVNQGESRMIPLIGTGNFNKVKVEWFSSSNLSTTGSTNVAFGTYKALQPGTLSNPNAVNVPAILRAQIIQIGSSFSLSDFDSTMDDSGSSTFFLYPQSSSIPTLFASSDLRKNPVATRPTPVTCVNTVNTAFSCSSEITLSTNIIGSDHSVFLHLSSIYGSGADYRVTLLNNSDTQPVSFNAIQPEVDSTGRANDLFKRVRTRVDLSNINFPYPVAAVETGGDFCKDFSITDNPVDYNAGSVGLFGNCNP